MSSITSSSASSGTVHCSKPGRYPGEGERERCTTAIRLKILTVLYFDCFSGASGDMILGALIDAGVKLDDVRRALGSLAIRPDAVWTESVSRGGIRSTKFNVRGETAPVDSHHDEHEHAHAVAESHRLESHSHQHAVSEPHGHTSAGSHRHESETPRHAASHSTRTLTE